MYPVITLLAALLCTAALACPPPMSVEETNGPGNYIVYDFEMKSLMGLVTRISENRVARVSDGSVPGRRHR